MTPDETIKKIIAKLNKCQELLYSCKHDLTEIKKYFKEDDE